MTMTVAFGMSIPTSITVVATRTSISRPAKRRMTASRSFAAIRPCITASRRPRNSSLPRSSAVAIALGTSSPPSSGIDPRRDDESLLAARDGEPDAFPDLWELLWCSQVRDDVLAPEGQLVDHRDIEVAVDGLVQRLRNRRR